MFKKISLTRGKIALVDLVDFDRLAQFSWYAIKGRKPECFYACRQYRENGHQYVILMHREILNASPDELVDHIKTGATLDNRRYNLRKATYAQNGINRGINGNNASGFKGVWLHLQTGKWRAGIRVSGKSISLGLYVEKEDAAVAYDRAAFEMFGEFAYLNFPFRRAA